MQKSCESTKKECALKDEDEAETDVYCYFNDFME